jgi:hypothetical protein
VLCSFHEFPDFSCVKRVFYSAFVWKCTYMCKHRFGVRLLQNPPLCSNTYCSVPVLYITDCTSGLPGVGLTGWAARDAARYIVFYPWSKDNHFFAVVPLNVADISKASACRTQREERLRKR